MTATTAATATPAETLAALRATVGTPQQLDLAVIAERDEEWTSRSRVALRLASEEGDRSAAPMSSTASGIRVPTEHAFSHYFPALARTFDGLEQGDRPNRLRLQF